ncbi:MAG: metalloregulator ArsR/SmtB family transcription factor [Acidobacteriota bacterium]|nr:metalloregulator ArsR/SmtB family transcription factor [Acidobacteriota bacterium]
MELERLFKGLADHSRLRIINLLLTGELCVCDIQYVLDSPQPNVSRHLAYLKHSGLVLDRREGQRMYYRLAEQGEGARRRLVAFLRAAFSGSEEFERDSRKLGKAIERGACNMAGGSQPARRKNAGATPAPNHRSSRIGRPGK